MDAETVAVVEERRGVCRLLLVVVLLVGSGAVFFAVGALGPPSGVAVPHTMYMCIVAHARRHMQDPTFDLIDEIACDQVGRVLETESPERMQLYPIGSVVLYAQIPHIKRHVMSRLFQFMVADLGIQFTSSEYPERLMKFGLNMITFEIALGYRDALSGPWKRLARGNVTRTLQCKANDWGYFTCDHFPLFELGSCHHKQYVVNLLLPSLPLGETVEQYSGLAPLSKLTIYEVHQSMGFTRLWLVLKSLLCPVSALTATWFLRRVSARKMSASLIEKSLAFLGVCLVLYNTPLELLSLYFDCPWLLVVNDFRQGLFIAALFSFWLIFIEEHRVSHETEVQSHIGHYWKQIGVVAVSCVFLFVYEFCERGIQVIYPFYSIWSNWLSSRIAWVFVGVAAVSMVLYALMFLVSVVGVYQKMRGKQKTLSQMSAAARKRFEGLFFRWKFFLALTTLVALVSVATITLPSEVLLHHWQQGKSYYSFYSALLTGNYGLWNTYVLLMMVLYAPSNTDTTGVSPGSDPKDGSAESDVATLQKLLTKQSQE